MSTLNATSRIAALIGTALLAASALLPTLSVADDMRTGGPPAEFVNYLKMKPMQLMHMMDAGKKGYVTKDEFMKFHEAMFDKMDKDHDGKLTPQEWLGRELRKSDG
jgi:EF hand